MILGNCGGLLLLALGALAAATIETPEASSQLTDAARAKPAPDDPEFFFISKLTGLWQAIKDEKGNLKAERRAQLSSMEKAIAMDYDYDKNRLFWSTYDGEIYSCPLRGRNVAEGDVKLIYSYSDWYPVSIAVDYISDLLYVIDSKTNSLSLMSLDGSTRTNMIRNFDSIMGEDFEPRYLEVDPFEGSIFFMDSYNAINHIYRMNTDGSDPRPIDNPAFRKQRRMGAFTLDRDSQRILVSSPYDRAIVSVDYMGGDSRSIINGENYASTLIINRKNSCLYFANITAYSMYSMGEKVTDIKKTDLYRCKYSSADRRCAPGSIERVSGSEWSAMLQLKAAREPARRPQQNQCQSRPCQQICIYTARRNNNYSCRCKTGYRLTAEGRCEAIDEFLIFENDNYVGGIDMAAPEPGLNRSNDEVFEPFKIRMRPTGDDQFGFDYDPLRERLLYSNNHEVIVKFLRNDTKYTTLMNPAKNYGLLAIDSTSKQFYFVEMCKNSSDYSMAKYSIGVAPILEPSMYNIDAVPQQTVMKLLRRDVGRVRSLAVYPALGYVFYVSYDAKSDEFRLTRMMVDGSKVTDLSAELGPVMYMALDYEEGKIYYIDDRNFVYRADFNGKRAERIIRLPMEGGSPLSYINGFSVYGDWIYVKNSNDIRRYNKELSYCQKWERYNPKPCNFDMRTQFRFHSRKTKATIPTPCSDKKLHGCQQLCFALPDGEGKLQPQCACDDGYKRNSDKKTCSN